MGFRFSLTSVLRVRESIEKREELALHKVQLEVEQAQHYLDELTEELVKASYKRAAALQNSLPAFRLQHMQTELNAAFGAKEALMDTLGNLKSQRDAQIKVYQAAQCQRQMLTDLFNRQRSVWEQNTARIRQKQLDDIFASRIQRS